MCSKLNSSETSYRLAEGAVVSASSGTRSGLLTRSWCGCAEGSIRQRSTLEACEYDRRIEASTQIPRSARLSEMKDPNERTDGEAARVSRLLPRGTGGRTNHVNNSSSFEKSRLRKLTGHCRHIRTWSQSREYRGTNRRAPC